MAYVDLPQKIITLVEEFVNLDPRPWGEEMQLQDYVRVDFWLDCLYFLKHPFTVRELFDISIETNEELTSKINYYNDVDSEISDLSFLGYRSD